MSNLAPGSGGRRDGTPRGRRAPGVYTLDAGALLAALYATSGQVNVMTLAILAAVTVYALGRSRR